MLKAESNNVSVEYVTVEYFPTVSSGFSGFDPLKNEHSAKFWCGLVS